MANCVNCGVEVSEDAVVHCPGCGDGPLCNACMTFHMCDNEEYELYHHDL